MRQRLCSIHENSERYSNLNLLPLHLIAYRSQNVVLFIYANFAYYMSLTSYISDDIKLLQYKQYFISNVLEGREKLYERYKHSNLNKSLVLYPRIASRKCLVSARKDNQ